MLSVPRRNVLQINPASDKHTKTSKAKLDPSACSSELKIKEKRIFYILGRRSKSQI